MGVKINFFVEVFSTIHILIPLTTIFKEVLGVNKLIYSLIALVLLSGSAYAVSSGEAQTSVTISDVISITLNTCPGASSDFTFGSISQGASNVAMSCQDASNGAIEITVDPETNVNVDIKISGTNFSGPSTILITNAKYNTSDDAVGATAFPAQGSNATAFSVTANPSAVSNSLWFWLDTPSWLQAGQYTSTFTFNAVKV